MKKKIKDLTLEECKQICLKNSCKNNCPLSLEPSGCWYGFKDYLVKTQKIIKSKQLEKEVLL